MSQQLPMPQRLTEGGRHKMSGGANSSKQSLRGRRGRRQRIDAWSGCHGCDCGRRNNNLFWELSYGHGWRGR